MPDRKMDKVLCDVCTLRVYVVLAAVAVSRQMLEVEWWVVFCEMKMV